MEDIRLSLTEKQLAVLVMALLHHVDALEHEKYKLVLENGTLAKLLNDERAKTGTEPSLAEALATHI